MKKILVTGVAGFIGMHVAQRLLAEDYQVIGIDNLNTYYPLALKQARLAQLTNHSNFRFYRQDIAEAGVLLSLFASEHFDAVIHLAAQAGVRYSLENPQAYIQTNLVGFANLLEACRHYPVTHLVYASSSSVYGLNTKVPFSESDFVDMPASLYAATKKSNELMAHSYSHLYQIPTTGLRFFTVYGEWGRPDMSPWLFTDAILKQRPIKIFNYGQMQRDFTYIDDIVDGIIKVIDNPSRTKNDFDAQKPNPSISTAPYKIYNIGNNSPIQLLDFIETLENSIGIEAKKNFLPMQDGDVVSTYADTNDLIKDFDYKPDTKLADGIDEFVKWYREFYSKEINK